VTFGGDLWGQHGMCASDFCTGVAVWALWVWTVGGGVNGLACCSHVFSCVCCVPLASIWGRRLSHGSGRMKIGRRAHNAQESTNLESTHLMQDMPFVALTQATTTNRINHLGALLTDNALPRFYYPLIKNLRLLHSLANTYTAALDNPTTACRAAVRVGCSTAQA